jgi:UDP-N-acetyl-D-mannosaminuronate dehydrogenase
MSPVAERLLERIQNGQERVGLGDVGLPLAVEFARNGLGGHCIPIDPFYLSWKVRQYGFDPR